MNILKELSAIQLRSMVNNTAGNLALGHIFYTKWQEKHPDKEVPRFSDIIRHQIIEQAEMQVQEVKKCH